MSADSSHHTAGTSRDSSDSKKNLLITIWTTWKLCVKTECVCSYRGENITAATTLDPLSFKCEFFTKRPLKISRAKGIEGIRYEATSRQYFTGIHTIYKETNGGILMVLRGVTRV
jgi:hypothetical protein